VRCDGAGGLRRRARFRTRLGGEARRDLAGLGDGRVEVDRGARPLTAAAHGADLPLRDHTSRSSDSRRSPVGDASGAVVVNTDVGTEGGLACALVCSRGSAGSQAGRRGRPVAAGSRVVHGREGTKSGANFLTVF